MHSNGDIAPYNTLSRHSTVIFMSNNIIKRPPPLLLLASLMIPVSVYAQNTDENLPAGVLASVNGRPIPQISVESVAQQIEEAGQEAEAGRILDELINLEVLTQEAEKLDMDKDPDIAAALQLQYTQTMANAYLARKSAEMSFSDEQLRAEYDAQSASVDRDEFKASHILLESEEQALNVLSMMKEGKSFSDAAAEYSIDATADNGGDLGWFVGATMVPEFAQAVATMQVNDISEQPVKSEFGYHIINLVDKRLAALPDFNAVKSGLTNLAVRRALAEHVDELKASSNIKR